MCRKLLIAMECSEKCVKTLEESMRNDKDEEKSETSSVSDEVPIKRVKIDANGDNEPSTSSVVKEKTDETSECTLEKVSPVVFNSSAPKDRSLHKIKWVDCDGSFIPIVTQNENGPCPLIAIVNVLLLKRSIALKSGTKEISADELVEYVRQAIESTVPKDCEPTNPNHLQNVQDAVAVLPQLQTGLDVNVKFTGVKNFEYTPECIIFDLLDIHLYHGWLLDPQSAEVVSAVGSSSYNQLVEIIINKKASSDPLERTQAEVAEQFLEATATQLTCHGLCELNATLENGEMAVLFRNNHFSVIYKKKDMLVQLVTDQGYLDEKKVVWETFSSIFGDETFLDGNFKSLLSKSPGAPYSSLHVIEEQQISQDFLVALSLQDEQDKLQGKELGWDAYGNTLGAIGVTYDEQLARRLYIEEQRMAQVTVSSARAATSSTTETSDHGIRPINANSSQPPAPIASRENEENTKSKEWKCTVS